MNATPFQIDIRPTMNHLRPLLTLLLLAGVLTPAFAAPMGCLIEPERITDVGSPVVGVIERIDVERGQMVRRGQVLAVLRAAVERATLGVASSRAEGDADIKAASASAAFNRERLVRAEDLYRQQFISVQALEQTRTETTLADQKLAQAKEQRQISQQERGVAAAQLSQRVIRSPIDGVVAERYLTPGERVDDKPLLRIARVDPLRVQLVVPITMYGAVQIGGLANVLPELPGAASLPARVTMIDRVVDSASNTFRVQLELPNANGALPAGLRCKAEFAVIAQAAPALPAAAPPFAPNAAPAPAPAASAAPVTPPTGAVRLRSGAVALAMTLTLPKIEPAEPPPPADALLALALRVRSPWAGRTEQVAIAELAEPIELPRVVIATVGGKPLRSPWAGRTEQVIVAEPTELPRVVVTGSVVKPSWVAAAARRAAAARVAGRIAHAAFTEPN